MSDADGQILIDIDADATAYEKEVGALAGRTDGIMSKVGSIGKAAGAAIAATAVAGTAAVVGLARQALDGYAQMEQLVGGVQTLFGRGDQSLEEYAASVGKSVGDAEGEYAKLTLAQNTVLHNADNAYKTAGMSANQYMEQATSTAAALVSSLGGDTVAAAKYADMAITDMSDNANKMGTDMGRITDAYNGFAKQNFTMLDNLKLGYGGTKEEMQRLLDDASKISGIKYDISSYSDIVDAIHVVQTEMGITGTTAKEASTTIEGSVKMAQASWSNWVTALGDDEADMEAMTAQLVESVATAAGNILPRLGVIATSIAQGIPALITQLVALVTSLIPSMLPQLLSAVTGMVTALAAAIPVLIPVLLSAALQLFLSIVDALVQAVPLIVAQLPMMVEQLVSALVGALPQLLSAGLTLFMALAMAIVEATPQIVSTLVGALPNIINTLVNFAPQLLAAAVQLFMALVRAIPQVVGSLLGAVGDMLGRIPGKAMEMAGQIFDVGKNIVQGIVDGIMSAPGAIADAIGGMIGDAMSWAKNLLGIASPSKVFRYYGRMIDEGLGLGVDKYRKIAVGAISRLVDGVESAADFKGVSVPLGFAPGTLASIEAQAVRFDASMERTRPTASAQAAGAQPSGLSELRDEIRDMGRRIADAYSQPVEIDWNRRELGRVVRSVG